MEGKEGRKGGREGGKEGRSDKGQTDVKTRSRCGHQRTEEGFYNSAHLSLEKQYLVFKDVLRHVFYMTKISRKSQLDGQKVRIKTRKQVLLHYVKH